MSAVLSPCERYRYRLERPLFDDGAGTVAVVMVNPSTADAIENDATITRLQRRFLKNEYLGRGKRPKTLVVGNLFAYRATDVRELAGAEDPVGPDNDNHLWTIGQEADWLMYGWGPLAKLPRGPLRWRWRDVAAMLECVVQADGPMCLGVSDDGQPRHPLMIAYSVPLRKWTMPY